MKKRLVCLVLVLFVVGMVSGCGGSDKTAPAAKASDIVQIEKVLSEFMDTFKEAGSKEPKARGSEPMKKAETIVKDKEVLAELTHQLSKLDAKFEVNYIVTTIDIDVEDGKISGAEAKVNVTGKVKDEVAEADFEFELEKNKDKWIITEFSQ